MTEAQESARRSRRRTAGVRSRLVSIEGTLSAQDSAGFRRANVKASWFERHRYPATCPGGLTRVDTESGSTSSAVRLKLHIQERVGAPYDISVAALDVPVKFKGRCPDGYREFTSERSVGLLTMSGKVKRVGEGLVLSGKKQSPPTMGPHGCDSYGSFVECSVTEALTWSLSSGRTKLDRPVIRISSIESWENNGRRKQSAPTR